MVEPTIRDIKKFERTLKRLHSKQSAISDTTELFILESMHLIHGASLIILKIRVEKNGESSENRSPLFRDDLLLYRLMVGPVLRFILEQFIKIMYICTASSNEEKLERLDLLTYSLGFEYKKFLKRIKDSQVFDSFVNGFCDIDESKCRRKTVKGIIDEISKNNPNIEYVYEAYAIACFYAHGTFGSVIWKRLFDGENPRQPCLKTNEVLFRIAAEMNTIMSQLWEERYPYIFEGL